MFLIENVRSTYQTSGNFVKLKTDRDYPLPVFGFSLNYIVIKGG